MARYPLAAGTHGSIRFSFTGNGWRAKARFRGYDGVIRDISRSAGSKTKAERDLKAAISREARTPASGDLSSRTRFRVVAQEWLAWQEYRAAAGERSLGTLGNYRSMLKNHVLPAFGELQLYEITVAMLDRFFPALQASSSAAHARTGRAVVGGVLQYATRRGALSANPIREINPIEGDTKRKRPRALSADERKTWLTRLESDPKAIRKDLPDLTRFLLATGVRIGEALALYWEDVLLEPNEDVGQIRVDWTVVREKGAGLIRTDPKTELSERTLHLPSWAVVMLRKRHVAAEAAGRLGASPVFPDTRGGLRDPSNTRRDFREARGSDEFAWLTTHNFRKTTATALDAAKLTAREIAAQLGHARPSMTQDVYMDRVAVSPAAAAALEGLL